MPASDRINSWLSLIANLAILVGIVLVLMELNQNTEHLRLQLRDQINARMYENNRSLLAGGAVVSAIAKSVTDPGSLTYQEFRIVDAHLINVINEWEDRFLLYEAGLVEATDWKQEVDRDVGWDFGNRFAKQWWREAGAPFVTGEFRRHLDAAIEGVDADASYGYWLRVRIGEE